MHLRRHYSPNAARRETSSGGPKEMMKRMLDPKPLPPIIPASTSDDGAGAGHPLHVESDPPPLVPEPAPVLPGLPPFFINNPCMWDPIHCGSGPGDIST